MSTWKELVEFIPSNTKSILVTGPQRSGTSIAAKMIAESGKYHYRDEETISIDNLQSFFAYHGSNANKPYVLQAPGLAFICHRLPVDLVVFMHRDVEDIKKSIGRINWFTPWNDYEAVKYFYSGTTNNSWELKYKIWEHFQRPHMDVTKRKYFELDYESLLDHPLWIDKPERKNFHARQTTK